MTATDLTIHIDATRARYIDALRTMRRCHMVEYRRRMADEAARACMLLTDLRAAERVHQTLTSCAGIAFAMGDTESARTFEARASEVVADVVGSETTCVS